MIVYIFIFQLTFLKFSFETMLYLKEGRIYHWGGGTDCPIKTGGVCMRDFPLVLSRHGFEANLINRTESFDYPN